MTAITDANTFIDQNLINVPYQGVPATTLNACLKTITNVFNSYATIASVNSLFGYALDGNFPAALMNAPNQAFTLNGGYVSISALLLFSSGQKYTVGPDGNYILNAANGPAWDWSTGRRRLLIEAIGATNLIRHSLDFTQSNWLKTAAGTGVAPVVTLNYGVAPDGTNTSTKVVFNTGAGTSSSDMSLLQQMFSASLGASYAHGVFLKASAGVQLLVRGAGSASYTKITATGSWQRVPVVEVAGTVSPFFEIGLRQGVSGAINSNITVEFWHVGVEAGTVLSSPIASGASPTARAGDIVTAASGLLALLNAAGVSFSLSMRGKLTAPQRSSLIGAGNTQASILLYSSVYIDVANAAGHGLLCAPGSGDLFTGDFGIAASSIVGGLIRKASANGSAVVSDNYTLFDGSETSMVIGGGNINFPANMLLDELIVWPIFASDAGLQAQARVYS